jgi:hypothetical protein
MSNESPEAEKAETLADDLLDGAEEIRAYLGAKTVDEIYYAYRAKIWPIGKIGKKYIASKRRLTRHANKLTQGF